MGPFHKQVFKFIDSMEERHQNKIETSKRRIKIITSGKTGQLKIMRKIRCQHEALQERRLKQGRIPATSRES